MGSMYSTSVIDTTSPPLWNSGHRSNEATHRLPAVCELTALVFPFYLAISLVI